MYNDLSPQAKTLFRNIVFLGSVAVIIALGMLSFSYWASGLNDLGQRRQNRVISVTGEAKVAVTPDIAVFTTSVVTNAAKVKDAQQENNRRAQAVREFLEQSGVEERDIKTVQYSIYPQYEYYEVPPCYSAPCPPRRPPTITSYEVRSTLEVKVRKLENADKLLDGVISNGANEIGMIEFKVDQEEKIRADAREDAIEDAKEKAKALSKELGIRLKSIVSFSESGPIYPIYGKGAAAGYGGGGDAAFGTPVVEPGEQEIRSIVTITYEFE